MEYPIDQVNRALTKTKREVMEYVKQVIQMEKVGDTPKEQKPRLLLKEVEDDE